MIFPKFEARKKALISNHNEIFDDFQITDLCTKATLLNPSIDAAQILDVEVLQNARRRIQSKIGPQTHPVEVQQQSGFAQFARTPGNLSVPLLQQLSLLSIHPDQLLSFWAEKLNDRIWSPLVVVAMKILGCLMTSASTERFFSRSRRVLTFDRMRMSPDLPEDQIVIMGNLDVSRRLFKI